MDCQTRQRTLTLPSRVVQFVESQARYRSISTDYWLTSLLQEYLNHQWKLGSEAASLSGMSATWVQMNANIPVELDDRLKEVADKQNPNSILYSLLLHAYRQQVKDVAVNQTLPRVTS